MNFFKWHIGDYARDTEHLSWDEDMAYTRLMRVYYRDEKPLPVERRKIYRLARCQSAGQRAAIDIVLSEFFSEEADGWHNKRCDMELALAKELGADQAARKDNERERQKRVRAHRKELFASLREHGIIPKYDTATGDLEAQLSRLVTGTNEERTQPVTRTYDKRTQDVTQKYEGRTEKATAIHYPLATSHYPLAREESEKDICPAALDGNGATNGNGALHPVEAGASTSPVERVFEHWKTTWHKPKAKLDPKRTKIIRTALKTYPPETLCEAIEGYRKSPFHMGKNDRQAEYADIELMLRDSKHIEAGLQFAMNTEARQWE
jgi:uncharacterized protein YdaU (DUF1376 family)